MAETNAGKKRTLVELTMKHLEGSELPQLCLVSSGEIAKDARMVSGISSLNYPGSVFVDAEVDFPRMQAILGAAPKSANAYLAGAARSDRQAGVGVLCSENDIPVVYFKIAETQVESR